MDGYRLCRRKMAMLAYKKAPARPTTWVACTICGKSFLGPHCHEQWKKHWLEKHKRGERVQCDCMYCSLARARA